MDITVYLMYMSESLRNCLQQEEMIVHDDRACQTVAVGYRRWNVAMWQNFSMEVTIWFQMCW